MGVFDVDYPHQLPTLALIQFAGANADPYFNYVCSIMSRPFKLSVRGQRNINTALSNMPVFYASDERLSFGWSFDNYVRSPMVHREGYENLAMIQVLVATFHESYSAEVLYAMASILGAPDDMMPHMRQIRDHVRSSNGVFAAVDFDTLVEDYIRLDPCSIGPGSNLLSRKCLLPPKSMAKGLIALSKVVSGEHKKLTLVGGAIIGWFAAVCEWLYDLRIVLYGPNGDWLHGDTLRDEAQVILVYNSNPILEVHDDSDKMVFNDSVTEELAAYSRSVHFLPFGGRVAWHSLLPRVFGAAFHHLDHERSNELATIIGAAARALEGGISRATADDPITPQNRTNPSAYGAGLIQNITAWLSELRKGEGRMSRQLRKSYEEAGQTYHDYIQRMEKICHCKICSVSEEEKPPRDGYCLTVIVETIISLGLAISRMTVSPGIYPTREGIQGLYDLQAEKRVEAKHIAHGTPEKFRIIYGNEWNASDSRRLQNAVELFSGRRPMVDIPDSLIAISHEGMCAYMVELWGSDARKQQNGNQGLIRVVSGKINVKNKLFTRMSKEPVVVEDADEDWGWAEYQFENCPRPMYLK